MTNDQLKEKILSIVPNAEVVVGKQYTEATIAPAHLVALAKTLKESDDTFFDYLFCLSGVDWGTGLGVVYHLTSTRHGHIVVLKVKAESKENPTIDSVSPIWKTAEFLEREVFDLFGIDFTNHPDMRRILLDENWQGFPLRKDYTDEINIVER